MSHNQGIQKIARAVRQDDSLPAIRQLISQGYTHGLWNTNESLHHERDICDIYNGNSFDLRKLISNLQYEAPVFETSHVQCFHKDTEVYTNQGFKKFSDLNKSELIATINPETSEFEWQKAHAYIGKPYTGEMYRYYNSWFESIITPDHNIFVEKEIQKNYKKEKIYSFITAKDLENSKGKVRRHFDIPLSAKYRNYESTNIIIGNVEFRDYEFATFMGYYLSEGSIGKITKKKHKNNTIRITQLKERNKIKIFDDLKDFCDRNDISLSLEKKGVRFSNPDVHKYLSQFGYSYQKYIPKEIIGLNKHCLNLFLDAYILGDGNISIKTKWGKHEQENPSYIKVIYTSSIDIRDGLCELILKAGYSYSYTLSASKGVKYNYKGIDFIKNKDVWKVSIKKSKTATSDRLKLEKIPYNDKVYCVSVPNRTLLVKNGMGAYWSGNCLCYLICYSATDRDLPYVVISWRGMGDSMGRTVDNSKSRERAKDFNNLYTRYRTIFDEIRSNKFLTGNQSDPDNGVYSFDVTVYGDYGYNQNVKNQLGNQILEIILNNATKYKIKVDNSSLIGNDYIIYTDNDMTFYDFTREDLINLTWNIKQRRDELNGVINDLNNLENFLIFTQEEINKLLVQYDNEN